MKIRNSKAILESLEEGRGYTKKEWLFAHSSTTGKCSRCPRHGIENAKASSYYRSKEHESGKKNFDRSTIRHMEIME